MNEQDKFLPVGTICTIRTSNKKVMITGFFSVEYFGSIKMYDYSACDYPEGLLAKNKSCSFNHDEIIKIEHLGLISQEHLVFNDLLNSQNKKEEQGYSSKDILSNIQFDENGVVAFETISSNYKKNNSIISPELKETTNLDNATFDNPFIATYEPEISFDLEVPLENNSKEWSIFRDIQFDENGVVISAEKNPKEETA